MKFPGCRVAETRKLAETRELSCHFADGEAQSRNGTLLGKVPEYWWIEKDYMGLGEYCHFVSCSDDGRRILLKGKAFAPVLVDISGFLSSPLEDDFYIEEIL